MIKKFIFGLLASILALVFVISHPAFSQSPSPTATPNQSVEVFTYPIEELGNCSDIGSCMNYCNDPINYNSCANFAKQHGFYEDDVALYASSDFWEDAKNELGCDSAPTCVTFCSQEQNYEACSSFAQRNNIPGGYTDEPDNPQYLDVAREVLGCDSPESCRTFCDNSDNSQRCSEFADRVGILGGTITQGPGGCQNQETCTSFCSDPANFSECQGFAPSDGTFSGPGGCNSETSCRNYCDQNSEECRSYSPGSNGIYVPLTCGQNEVHGPGGVCTRIPDYKLAVYCSDEGGLW